MSLTVVVAAVAAVLAAGRGDAAPDFRHRYALPPSMVPAVQPWNQFQHRHGASYVHGYQVPGSLQYQASGSPVLWQPRLPVVYSPIVGAPAPGSADPYSPASLEADSAAVEEQQVVESQAALSHAVRQEGVQALSAEEDPAELLVPAAETQGQQVVNSPTFNLGVDEEDDRFQAQFSPLLKFASKAGVLQKIGRTPSGTEQYEVAPKLAEQAGGVSALAYRLGANVVAAVHDVQQPPWKVDPYSSYKPLLVHRDEVSPKVTLYTLEVHGQ